MRLGVMRSYLIYGNIITIWELYSYYYQADIQ